MLLITKGRYFPTKTDTQVILCPHERIVRPAQQTKFWIMIGLFFVPLIPAGCTTVWNCSTCGNIVVPNQGGQYSRLILLRNAVFALIGLMMLTGFGYCGFTAGGKNSAFDPGAIPAVRVFCALFATLGFIIIIASLISMARLHREASAVGQLTPEQTARVLAAIEQDDTLEIVVAKLKYAGFDELEIQSFVGSWTFSEM